MEIRFQKMHGTLNDFVVFHDFDQVINLAPEQVRLICHRRAGVGADGVIIIRKSSVAAFFMDYVNADGSLAEMCGNGIRCLAKYVYDNGFATTTTLHVETRAGVKTLELFPDSDGKILRVRVDMGKPIFDPEQIPVNIHTNDLPIVDYPVEVDGRIFPAVILSMGNPHCVIITDEDPDSLAREFGPLIEKQPLFPARSNVEFIRIADRGRIVMRVWERGSGETLACGTGACAAMVAAALKDRVDLSAAVQLLGGSLEIEWKGSTYPVFMTGEAILAYSGAITI
jgi:diaminopimelate epimerase